MRVYTRSVLDIETGTIVDSDFYEYDGPVCELKGPTGEERALQAKQAAFYDTLTQSYQQQFAGQSAILKSLSDVWTPILTGVGPKSPAEIAARSQVTEGTAAEYQKAVKATKADMAARGMGQEVIPSGAEEQVLGGIAAQAAAQESQQQLGITTGLFKTASDVLGQTAGLYAPAQFSGQATGAGSAAFESAKTIQQQQAAASPWGAIGGALGGIAGTMIGGPAGGQMGAKLGGALGGAV